MSDTLNAEFFDPVSGAPTPEQPVFDIAAETPKVAQVADDADYAKLPAGTKFLAPDGTTRFKPIASDADYAKLPEGAEFFDPEGVKRKKPTFEGVNYTTQTLYDMALTPKEKRKILERDYPGKVKEDPEGLYVDDEGTFRRPGRGDWLGKKGAAAATAAALPVTLGVLGAVGGGVAGTAAPGVGNVAGVMAGGAAGSTLGQFFNDLILQISGVKDRTVAEEAGNLGLAAATGGMGAGVGRGAAAFVPTIKEGITAVGQVAPKAMAHFLGANADTAATTLARELAEKGVQVPPSAWAKEAPHLQNVVEVFDPAFRTQAPLLESATKHYEGGAKQVLEGLGVKDAGPLTKPVADVPTQPAGEALIARAMTQSQEADAALAEALAQRRATTVASLPENIAQREIILKNAEESRKAAQALIDAGFAGLKADTDVAMKMAKAGHNSGDLWWGFGEKLRAIRQGIGERARMFYDSADEAAGSVLPRTEGLPIVAKDFLDSLPGEFRNKYPDMVRKLEDLAGKFDDVTGEVLKEPVHPTFGQLHNLRSQFRNGVNYYDLTPDQREGAYKFFATKIDNILHDPKAAPELQLASQILDSTDKWYGEAIRPLTDKRIQAVLDGLKSDMPADPKILYDVVVKEGRTELADKIKNYVGPNLWAGVRGADVEEMLAMSKTHVPGDIDGRVFARQVLDRERTGLLETVHGKDMAAKLRQQAQRIEALDGRLDVKMLPGDTAMDVISRARVAADEVKQFANKDPLAALNKEMKKIEADHSRQVAKARKNRRNDPLGFLYEPTAGASEAVNKILGSEDLILASAARFGEKSSEFNMLRQVYAQRILQGTMNPGKALENVSPEIQMIMFPGISLNQMQTLAKEMSFLLGAQGLNKGTAQGMSAMAKVENPWSHIAGRGGPFGKVLGDATKIIPGSGPAGRAWLTKYYSIVTNVMTSPATLRFIEKGVSGSPEERAAVASILRKHLQKGGAVGAGVGEALYQQPRDEKRR